MTYSELRASDAERERVVAFLREHALLGRLTNDELEDRIGLAYASVTIGDLEKLISDLPRANRPAPAPARRHHGHTHATAHRRRRQGPPAPAIIALSMGVLLISGVGLAAVGLVLAIGVALLATVFALSMVLGPILLVALLIIAATKRHHRRPPARWRPQY
jgi:ABC-type nickel/cobalt efflux system permease component RcnA